MSGQFLAFVNFFLPSVKSMAHETWLAPAGFLASMLTGAASGAALIACIVVGTFFAARSRDDADTTTLVYYKLNVQRRILLLIVIAVIVIGTTGYVIYDLVQSGKRNIENTYFNEQRKVAESVSANMEELNQTSLNTLNDLSQQPCVEDVRTDSMRLAFRVTFLLWENMAYSITRTDEHGILRYTYPETPGAAGSDISAQLHIRRLLATHDTIFTGIFTSVQGKRTFAMYVPVYARNRVGGGRHFAGGVGMLLNIDAYARRAFRNTQIFTPTPLAAINTHGMIIVATDNQHAGERAREYLRGLFPTLAGEDSLKAVAEHLASLSFPQYIKIVSSAPDSSPQWLVAHPLRFCNQPWGVIILPVSNEQVYAVYNGTTGRQMVMGGVFAIVLLCLIVAVVVIFYQWSRFLEDEVRREVAIVREVEGKYTKLFNEAVVGIFQTAPDGALLSANPSMAAMLGYATTAEFIASDALRRLDVNGQETTPWSEIRRHQGTGSTVALRRADNAVIHVLVHCKAIMAPDNSIQQYEGFVEDVTDRKTMEQQLLQAQKLEGIGTLAGGIAHDFNNLLAMILGSAELLRLHTVDYPKLKNYVDRIVEASERGASISRQLLIFSRPDQAELKKISLSGVITELEELLRHFLPKSVSIETRVSADADIIMGDAGHLHQALLNLALNANDAMPSGGSLVITEFPAPYETVHAKFPLCQPGPYVGVSIADTGIGIDASVKAKIFDPFFSTKERGKGTGLGLSIVHGIVKSHQGHIHVESMPSHGSIFTLYLPIVTSRALQAAPSGMVVEKGNHQTVLIVDDEELIRDLLKEYLESEGYTVFSASDGKEALHLYEERYASIDVVITDLGMPEMGGEELFRCLRTINPSARVLVSSGYLDKSTKDKLIGMGIYDVLTKPYRLELIHAAIEAIRE